MPLESPVKTYHHAAYPAISPLRPELSTAGKTVVITGGARGIGLAVARAFAASGASRLGLISRDQNSLDTAATALSTDFPTTKIAVATANISDESSINAAFDAVANAFGGRTIDIVVLNAGYLSKPTAAAAPDLDLNEWWTSYTTNVLGLLLSFRAFHRHAAVDATVLHMSTSMLHLPAMPNPCSAYASSKAAGLKLIDQIKVENPSLRIFNMHPGVVETDMGSKSGIGGQDHVDLPGHFSVWLVSDEAAFLRNKFVWANWDVEELVERKHDVIGSDMLEVGLLGLSFRGSQFDMYTPL